MGATLMSCGGGGGRADDANGARRTKVVAGFYPIAEAATRIGGGRIEVANLTPAGTEPHDLELTTDQVDELEDADLVLYVGGGFQPAVERVADRRPGASLDVLDGLPLDETDPHFWLDPLLMLEAVGRIESALAKIRPDDRAELSRNAESYRSELRALDGEYRATLHGCRRRDLVTSHAAFHYLARRYGLTQRPIAGLSPEGEPNPDRLAELIDTVRRHMVTTIFHEPLVSPRVAQTLARDSGARVAVLDPIEGLSEEKARAGATYASVMRQNLEALKNGLGC